MGGCRCVVPATAVEVESEQSVERGRTTPGLPCQVQGGLAPVGVPEQEEAGPDRVTVGIVGERSAQQPGLFGEWETVRESGPTGRSRAVPPRGRCAPARWRERAARYAGRPDRRSIRVTWPGRERRRARTWSLRRPVRPARRRGGGGRGPARSARLPAGGDVVPGRGDVRRSHRPRRSGAHAGTPSASPAEVAGGTVPPAAVPGTGGGVRQDRWCLDGQRYHDVPGLLGARRAVGVELGQPGLDAQGHAAARSR